MPTSEKQPILYGHLTYSIRKIIFNDGRGIQPAAGRGIPAAIVPSKTERGIMFMELPSRFTRRNWRLLNEWRVKQICYQVMHTPSGEISPIYDHEFNGDPLKRMGGILFLGPMKLYPAEQVWPELTRKGYYGELPQFFT